MTQKPDLSFWKLWNLSFGFFGVQIATLSYQIGPAKLLGNGRYPKASLLTRLERGDRDILPLYLSYCKWRGKAVASIRKRRWVEYQLLYAER